MWESPPLIFLTVEVSVRGDKVKVCTVGPPLSPNCCIRKPAPLVQVMPPSETLLRSARHLPPSPGSGMDTSCYEIRWWEPVLCPLFTMWGWGLGAGAGAKRTGREQREDHQGAGCPLRSLDTSLCLPEVLQCTWKDSRHPSPTTNPLATQLQGQSRPATDL